VFGKLESRWRLNLPNKHAICPGLCHGSISLNARYANKCQGANISWRIHPDNSRISLLNGVFWMNREPEEKGCSV
jgi:hypothetical protein